MPHNTTRVVSEQGGQNIQGEVGAAEVGEAGFWGDMPKLLTHFDSL